MIFWLAERTPRERKLDKKNDKSAPGKTAAGPQETGRETFDQLIYSFALLIVGRAFFLEPFVIPTGSMAPTLYGRHKECVCTSCGFEYQVGASSEVSETNQRIVIEQRRIRSTVCPNCRKTHDSTDAMAFNGDHVAVNKWAYQLGQPSRFDVFVFKYPNAAYKNYIKRVVGLPGETLAIRAGDLYLVTEDGEQILRKPEPRKRRAMTQVVHDNNWRSPTLRQAGWPERWQAVSSAGETIEPNDDRALTVPAGATARYTHAVPSSDDWAAIEMGLPVEPSASLVSDFCFYNASSQLAAREGVTFRTSDIGHVWVPDIGFEADVIVEPSDKPELILELCEGVYRFRCRIDALSGKATLVDVNVQQDPTEERPIAEATTRVRTGKSFHIRFSNIDDELMLWIDGEPVAFGDAARYARTRMDYTLPTKQDLSPIAITSSSGQATLSNLRVFRDVYYISELSPKIDGAAKNLSEANELLAQRKLLRRELEQRLRNPDAYAEYLSNAPDTLQTVRISAEEGYLAFGDNSPASKDSRVWSGEQPWVAPRLLVGKAFFVYWPHGTPFLNGGRGVPLRSHVCSRQTPKGTRLVKVENYPRYVMPFYPQFERMARIR